MRYLAHLFLGGVAERDKRFDDARREYEAAFEIGAGYQAACVALSRAEERAGHSSRAREISPQCVQLWAHEDPWWDYRIKFDHDALYQMTHEFSRITAALAQLNGAGATSLRDAVHLAIELAPRAASAAARLHRGHDTSSWLTEEAVLDTTRRAGVVIHVVRVESDAFLEKLTDVSGGRTWSATSDRQLRELFTRALEEMRARYLLAYTPAGVKRAGWHEIRVRLNVGRADITAPPGYFVAEQ